MPAMKREPAPSRRRLSPSVRRALIDEAATRVFAERGYEAATMQEIARTAGVVASVLYDHYPSKRELYSALLAQHGRILIDRSIRSPDGVDLRVELRQQIDDFFAAIEADPFVWRMLFRDPPGDPGAAKAHAQVQARAATAIAAVLGAAHGGADLIAEPVDSKAAMAAEMIKSSLGGLAVWWWGHRKVSREDVVDAATALIWDGLARAP